MLYCIVYCIAVLFNRSIGVITCMYVCMYVYCKLIPSWLQFQVIYVCMYVCMVIPIVDVFVTLKRSFTSVINTQYS